MVHINTIAMGCGASGNSMEYKFNAVHPQQLPKSGGTSGGSANNGSRRLVMPGGEGSLKKKAPVLALADFGNPRFNGLKQMISNKGSKTAFIRFLFTIKYSTSILQKYVSAYFYSVSALINHYDD